jgi:hypothetical protein
MDDNDLLTPKELAEWFGKTEAMLGQWRYVGQGPPFIHVGRSVRYRRGDVLGWLEQNTTRPVAS